MILLQCFDFTYFNVPCFDFFIAWGNHFNFNQYDMYLSSSVKVWKSALTQNNPQWHTRLQFCLYIWYLNEFQTCSIMFALFVAAVRDIVQRPLPVHGHLLKERVTSVLQTVKVTTALKKKVRSIVFFEWTNTSDVSQQHSNDVILQIC